MGAGLAAGNVAPFVQGLAIDAQPDPLSPTGASFGASGTATSTIIGPVLAGLEQALAPTMIGAAPTETIGSTDGTATGSFTYTHTFANVPALGRQITGVSWASGATTLTASAVLFQAGDVGKFVAGPAAVAPETSSPINPQSTITAVAGDGLSATISIATTAARTNVAIGTGENMTFADPAFSTGNVFTTNGVEGGKANIGVTSVSSVGVNNNVLNLVFGGQPGTSTSTSDARCLLTGFDGASNPGPAQFGQLTPLLPPGTTTALVLASGGFITQPNTAQAITPPAAAFVNLVTPDTTPPVAGNATATIDRNVSNTTTLALPATDDVAVASCALVGSPSDPRLSVSISNSPTPCAATLTDNGSASVGATVTFQYNATDTSGNVSASPGTVTVNIIGQVIDGSLDVIVSGPTRTAAGDKTIVGKVTNLGTGPLTVCDTDIAWAITVNGAPTTGSVTPKNAGCSTLGPGSSHRFRFTWTFGAGEVSAGVVVDYTGTVNVAGDVNAGNNTDTETRTAK
jgi:hypothetical protein